MEVLVLDPGALVHQLEPPPHRLRRCTVDSVHPLADQGLLILVTIPQELAKKVPLEFPVSPSGARADVPFKEYPLDAVLLVLSDRRRELLEVREWHQAVQVIRAIVPDVKLISQSRPALEIPHELGGGFVRATFIRVCLAGINRAKPDTYIAPRRDSVRR